MKRIILFLAIVVSVFMCFGQPKSNGQRTTQTQTNTTRTQTPSKTTTPVARPVQPSKTYTPARQQTTPSTTRTQTPNKPQTTSVEKRPVQQNQPRPEQHTSGTSQGKHTVYHGHRGDGHNPQQGGHENKPQNPPHGTTPPPPPPHHPYEHSYHHPYHHRDVHMHRVYWNPYCPVVVIDGFWLYTHSYYYTHYGIRHSYIGTFNSVASVHIIDYVVDGVYTYCIERVGLEKYFRVYDQNDILIAQQKIGIKYNELILDEVSDGVWCIGNKDTDNLFFMMENGRLICYVE